MTPHEALAGLVILSAVNGAITWIITESSLFERLRERRHGGMLQELLSCPLCTGTWVGIGIAIAAIWEAGYSGIDALLAGIVVTFSTVIGGLLLKRWASY